MCPPSPIFDDIPRLKKPDRETSDEDIGIGYFFGQNLVNIAPIYFEVKVLFARFNGIWIELIGVNRLYFAGFFESEVDPSDSRKE